MIQIKKFNLIYIAKIVERGLHVLLNQKRTNNSKGHLKILQINIPSNLAQLKNLIGYIEF